MQYPICYAAVASLVASLVLSFCAAGETCYEGFSVSTDSLSEVYCNGPQLCYTSGFNVYFQGNSSRTRTFLGRMSDCDRSGTNWNYKFLFSRNSYTLQLNSDQQSCDEYKYCNLVGQYKWDCDQSNTYVSYIRCWESKAFQHLICN